MNTLRLFKQARHLPTYLSKRGNSISALQAAFRDPSSPFHIAPGEKGPTSPDEVPALVAVADTLEVARQKLIDAGLDPTSFWEQRIVWGDLDSFRHVNNARYVRFFETARITWMTSLGNELGGPSRAEAMIQGRGLSMILKSIKVQFKRPVTFPDTLLIGCRPKLPSEAPPDARKDPATFYTTASAYSLTQRAFVAHSDEAIVWYDYDKLKKCEPGEAAMEMLWKRANLKKHS